MTQDMSSMVNRIDGVRLSRSDRRIVREYARDAEMAAEIVCRAGANIRAAVAFMSNALEQRAGSGIAEQR
jgi:hypothetical protein